MITEAQIEFIANGGYGRLLLLNPADASDWLQFGYNVLAILYAGGFKYFVFTDMVEFTDALREDTKWPQELLERLIVAFRHSNFAWMDSVNAPKVFQVFDHKLSKIPDISELRKI